MNLETRNWTEKIGMEVEIHGNYKILWLEVGREVPNFFNYSISKHALF